VLGVTAALSVVLVLADLPSAGGPGRARQPPIEAPLPLDRNPRLVGATFAILRAM
jgi:hypothetical protein